MDHRLSGRLHGLLTGAATTVTSSGANRTAGSEDDHTAGLVAPLHWSDVNIVQRGIVANNAVLATWFVQMGSQTIADTTSSAENWSVVNTFKLAVSRTSSRLDPGSRSSRMISFTPVYIHARRWDWSWRGARHFDRKSCSTISEVRPFSARYWIQSSTGLKPSSRPGSLTHSVRSRVGPSIGSVSRSWTSACTSTQSSLHRSHLPGEMGAM
jgi:hypothetical protein